MTQDSGLASLVRQLEQTEWADAATLATQQRRQLARMAEQAVAQSPHFLRRMAAAGLTVTDLLEPDGLARLPVLTRREVQSVGSDLFCAQVPPAHGEVRIAETSGSTGEPVVVRKTGMTAFLWLAMTMRDHRWHGRNLSAKLCSIRPGNPTHVIHPSWGPPASLFADTGPMLSLSIGTDAAQLVRRIAEFAPEYLLVYPSTLEAIARHCRRHGQSLRSLRQIRTIGETLHASVRTFVSETFGVTVADCYSCREIGYLALMCPQSGAYHVMAEGVIAEVVDAAGRPCVPGEVGRVLVTDLHNYATPLVRYEIGDYAEVAPPCWCGRGLPTWARIVGRERNMLLRADGTRHWPLTGFYNCRDVAPIVQYQLVQHDRRTVEARLVAERPLTAAEQAALRQRFDAATGGEFALQFSFVSGPLAPAASGKFEDFICRATPDMTP